MAAAMVNLARYRGRDFFWDPFCGSGTIVIEAALAALNRAPGLARKFAAQSWSCIPEDVWTQAREAARAAEFRGEYRILGTDIDSGSLAIAIANAKKAGVSKYIEFREADATRESLPCDRGLIVCNPPYGERMLEQRSAQQLMRQFGRHLRFADGWKNISSPPSRNSSTTLASRPRKSASSTTAACSAMSICISERGADACGMYF